MVSPRLSSSSTIRIVTTGCSDSQYTQRRETMAKRKHAFTTLLQLNNHCQALAQLLFGQCT